MPNQTINKIEFLCPVCSSNDLKEIYPDTIGDRSVSFDYNFTKTYNLTFRIVKCRNCSHRYATPRPGNMGSCYNNDKEDPIYLKNKDQRIATSYNVLKIIKKYKNSGRLLDVGCATGDFLTVAGEDFEVEGLELSAWSTRIARQRGLYIHNKLLIEMNTHNTYDVVALWGVIEHFEYLKEEMENISKILKKGGIVCVWTGNSGSILARLLGKKWWWYQGQHIQMFNKKSICYLFNRCGFKKIYMGYYPYVVTIYSMNNTLSMYPLISRITTSILSSKILTNIKFTLKLPGEMFAIFEKQ